MSREYDTPVDAMQSALKKAVGTILILQVVSEEPMGVQDVYIKLNDKMNQTLSFSMQYNTISNRLTEEKHFLSKQRKRNDEYKMIDYYYITPTGISKLAHLKLQFHAYIKTVDHYLNNDQISPVEIEFEIYFINLMKKSLSPMLILHTLNFADMRIVDISERLNSPLLRIVSPDKAIYSLQKQGYLCKYKRRNEHGHKKNYYTITDRGKFILYQLRQKYKYITNRVIEIIGGPPQ